MTLNPRCSWRALVVLTAALAAPMAATIVHAADVTSTTATATTQPSTATASGASSTTTTDTSGSASASSSSSAAANEQADWSATMNQLATLLAGKDLPALQRMLRPSPVIRPFSSDALQTHARLLGATTGATVLGVHAYEKPPTTLASDLAEDFASAGEVVPQHVREGMVPPDDAAARRANETAAEWLVQVLQPEKHEVSGVIVLWPPTRSRTLAAQPRRAIFVLVKGEPVDGQYVLRQITFGDPLETPQ